MGARIGIDLGGTKLAGVAVDGAGRVTAGPLELPTGRQRPPAAILDDLAALVGRLQSGAGEAEAVGIGIPSTLDASGAFVDCPNLPTMAGVRIREELESRLGRGIALDNDANCFAWGEWRAGAGRGTRTLCGVTLGTGIGMGIVIGGRLHRGRGGSAGEICYAPFREGRTVEDVVAGPAVAARYRERTGAAVEAREVAARARDGDPAAAAIWREFGEALGFGLCYAVNLLAPDAVVLGGSLAGARDLFEDAMKHLLQRHAYDYPSLRILPAELGAVAGAVGAAFLDPADGA
ncbi:MAG: ROK family protein [Gemmatimonadota bacterium]